MEQSDRRRMTCHQCGKLNDSSYQLRIGVCPECLDAYVCERCGKVAPAWAAQDGHTLVCRECFMAEQPKAQPQIFVLRARPLTMD